MDCQYFLCYEPGKIAAGFYGYPYGIRDGLFVLFFVCPEHGQANKMLLWANKARKIYFRFTGMFKQEYYFC